MYEVSKAAGYCQKKPAQNAMSREEFEKIVTTKKINPESQASDFIFCCRFFNIIYYLNTASHKISLEFNKVVRGDKNFIVRNKIKNKKNIAYYMYEDKETDILYFTYYILKRTLFGYKWKEIARFAFGRDDNVFVKSSSCFDKISAFIEEAFDICGQINIARMQYTDRKYILDHIKMGSQNYLHGYINDLGAKNTLFSYFGGRAYLDGFLVSFQNARSAANYIMTNSLEKFVITPMSELDETDFVDPVTLMRLKSFAEEKKKSFLSGGRLYKPNSFLFSYVKKVQGSFRCYSLCINFLGTGTSPSGYKAYICASDIGPVIDLMEGLSYNTVIGFFGDVEGTEFAHRDFYIKQWLDMVDAQASQEGYYMKKSYTEYSQPVYSQSVINSAESLMRKLYGFPGSEILTFTRMLILHPMVEKILNMYPGDNQFIRTIYTKYHCAVQYGADEYNWVEQVFGKVDETQSALNKALMLPKGMFEYIVGKEGIKANVITFIKNMFPDDFYEYFMRLDKESIKYLVDTLEDISRFHSSRPIYDLFSKMVKQYGINNWKEYLSVFDFMCRCHLFSYYEKYIEMAGEFGVIGKKIGWKFKDSDSFNSAYEKLSAIYKDMSNEINRRGMEQYYEKNKHYEYSDGKFCLLVPKTPDEIAEEGIRLHHCVKEFIQPVIQGKTSIFFIRLKEEKDAPYYTLEVRDNNVRQCHGFDNMKASPNIKEFVARFCDKNGICYDLDKMDDVHGI